MDERVNRENWGYKNELYDRNLENLLENITPEQKKQIPNQLLVKIFKNKAASVNTLSEQQKDYIYYFLFNKRIYKIVEDNERGMNIEEFIKARDTYSRNRQAKKMLTVPDATGDMHFYGMFILGTKDLVDAMSYFWIVSHMPTFKLLSEVRKTAKRIKNSKMEQVKHHTINLVRMISNYEAVKKRIPMEYSLTMPEWYMLMFFYDGEKKGSTGYREKYIYAYSASKNNLAGALVRLTKDGFLDRRGKAGRATYSLTPKGKDIVDKILLKVILNY